MIVFGPIPSRRLGRSLGINNIHSKTCSYSCVYCQVGRTSQLLIERKKFYQPEEILYQVGIKINQLQKMNESIDYITIVPDGEPTLDKNLGHLIELLKVFNIKIAVITNGSLLWKQDVREDLYKADLVSVKIDTMTKSVWEKINRPQSKLTLQKIIEGINNFCRQFEGELLTETMLVKGINDSAESITGTAMLIKWIDPQTANLMIPIRPPAESWVRSPENRTVTRAYNIFKQKIAEVELVNGYEGNDFTATGDIENELLSTLSVHPMREDAIEHLLNKYKSDLSIIKKLLLEEELYEIEYNGEKYYKRNFQKQTSN